jgi:hypothetical protein
MALQFALAHPDWANVWDDLLKMHPFNGEPRSEHNQPSNEQLARAQLEAEAALYELYVQRLKAAPPPLFRPRL